MCRRFKTCRGRTAVVTRQLFFFVIDSTSSMRQVLNRSCRAKRKAHRMCEPQGKSLRPRGAVPKAAAEASAASEAAAREQAAKGGILPTVSSVSINNILKFDMRLGASSFLSRNDVRERACLSLFIQIFERVDVERIRRPAARRFQIDDVEAYRMRNGQHFARIE